MLEKMNAKKAAFRDLVCLYFKGLSERGKKNHIFFNIIISTQEVFFVFFFTQPLLGLGRGAQPLPIFGNVRQELRCGGIFIFYFIFLHSSPPLLSPPLFSAQEKSLHYSWLISFYTSHPASGEFLVLISSLNRNQYSREIGLNILKLVKCLQSCIKANILLENVIGDAVYVIN